MERNDMLVLFFCLMIQFTGIHGQNLTRSDLLRRLTNKTIYDPNYPPGYDNGDPIVVIVQLDIFDLTSISEQEMQYSLMMLMRMQWQDERLAFKDIANFSQLYLTGERVELVWTPDLYIMNERKSDAHSFIKSEELIYMNPEGIVTFSERFSITNVCHMNLMQYPFDEQKCVITIMSYAITSNDMILQWPEKGVLHGHFNLSNYDINVDSCTEGILSDESKSVAGGSFSYLNVTLKIDRKSGAYGSMYFAPFPLFFIIAMASFAFREQISSRITLCTAGISSSVLQWIAIYSRLPPVWYLTYLDGWILGHICMIGSLLVYHSVWYMILHQSLKEQNEFEALLREVESIKIDARDYRCLSDLFEELSTEAAKKLKEDLKDNKDDRFRGYLESSRKDARGQVEYEMFARVEEGKDFSCKSLEELMNSDQLSVKARKKLINDQRYMLICDKDRKKYYENYKNRKDNNICIKAFKKNYVDTWAFVFALFLYSWIILLFCNWANLSNSLLAIPSVFWGLVFVVFVVFVCKHYYSKWKLAKLTRKSEDQPDTSVNKYRDQCAKWRERFCFCGPCKGTGEQAYLLASGNSQRCTNC